jgi:hypothetical protein
VYSEMQGRQNTAGDLMNHKYVIRASKSYIPDVVSQDAETVQPRGKCVPQRDRWADGGLESTQSGAE